jgi:hypothetical protein
VKKIKAWGSASTLSLFLLSHGSQARDRDFENYPRRETCDESLRKNEILGELRQRLAELRSDDELPAPDLIEAREQSDRIMVRRALRRGYGNDSASILEILDAHRLRRTVLGENFNDGLRRREGTVVDGPHPLKRLADGKRRSCVLLYDEKWIRFADDHSSGGHFNMTAGRPVSAAAEMSFVQQKDDQGSSELVLVLNPKSGYYNDPFKGNSSDRFNTYEPLAKIVEAVWRAQIFPDRIVVQTEGGVSTHFSMDARQETSATSEYDL